MWTLKNVNFDKCECRKCEFWQMWILTNVNFEKRSLMLASLAIPKNNIFGMWIAKEFLAFMYRNLFFKVCLFALWSRSSKLHWNAICHAWSQNSSCKYGEKLRTFALETYSGATCIGPLQFHYCLSKKWPLH